MGSFIGHLIPGSSLFVYGFYWLVLVLRQYFQCRQLRQRFRSTLTFPVHLCFGRCLKTVPLESVMKLVLFAVGTGAEIHGGTNHITHRFDSIGNTQHITMYFFFGLSGVFDILTVKGLAPVGSDYVALAIALLVEGALFKFHLFGRTELDVLVHVLLLYVIGFTVLVVLLEAAFRRTPILPLLRSMLVMLQGAWFIGVGFILYDPVHGSHSWDEHSHRSLMLSVVIFAWFIAAILLLALTVGVVVARCHRQQHGYSQLKQRLPMSKLPSGDEDEEEAIFSRESGDDRNGNGRYCDCSGRYCDCSGRYCDCSGRYCDDGERCRKDDAGRCRDIPGDGLANGNIVRNLEKLEKDDEF